MGTLTLRKQGDRTYYIYQESYRQKVNPEDSGKVRGSGRSQVRTRAIYLGSAEKILHCVQEKRKPIEVKVRHFGLIGAAYQTAQCLGLPELLKKHIPGRRYGVPRWIYFLVTVINRLDQATSKNKMSQWLKKTILPELLGFDEKKLTSKHFWSVTEDILSEKELSEKRAKDPEEEDLFVGLDETVFSAIEVELFRHIDELIGLSPSLICYDTTNFYTYIDEPKRSQLAHACHSKEAKHHLKHVGLLMAVDRIYGIPLVNRIYRANCHDSKVFSVILSDLILSLKHLCGQDSDLTLILDKGNNKKETFNALYGKISWVGSLSPYHYEELIELALSDYVGIWKGKPYYRCEREVMGLPCLIVLVFNPATKRKQEASLRRGIEKLKVEILQKWEGYKRTPKALTPGIQSMKKKSHYGKYLKLGVHQGQLDFQEDEEAIRKKSRYLGKHLIFSNMREAETGYLIDTYAGKNIIEDDFHLLKDTTLIRFRPIRHWTDTKIRAYAFCCVLSMTLMRVMQWKVEQVGYKMSPNLLKEELTDLQEIVMVYSSKDAERRISQRSTVQNKLWEVFQLGEIEMQLLLH
jgi:transposase